MNEKNESAASAAGDDAAASAAAGATTDAVVHPGKPPVMPDPVPAPHAVVGDEPGEIVDVRESALENEEVAGDPRLRRFITLGETVYYGDGTGNVHPAMIVHVYGKPAANEEDQNDTYVDLQVFKRKSVCDVERIPQHSSDEGALNGWVFKA